MEKAEDDQTVSVNMSYNEMTGTVKFGCVEELKIAGDVVGKCCQLQKEIFEAALLALTWHESIGENVGIFKVPSLIHVIKTITEDLFNKTAPSLQNSDLTECEINKERKIQIKRMSKVVQLCYLILHHFGPFLKKEECNKIIDDIKWLKKSRSKYMNGGEISLNWNNVFCPCCEGDCIWTQEQGSAFSEKILKRKHEDKCIDESALKKICFPQVEDPLEIDHDPWNYTGPEPPWAHDDVDWSKLPWRDMLIRQIPSYKLPWRNEIGAWGGVDTEIFLNTTQSPGSEYAFDDSEDFDQFQWQQYENVYESATDAYFSDISD